MILIDLVIFLMRKVCDSIMLCDNCHKNEATIHLYTSVNGQRRQINLCQNCYQLLKNQEQQPNNGVGGADMAQDPFGFGGLDDIFRAMPPCPEVNRPVCCAGLNKALNASKWSRSSLASWDCVIQE